MGVRVRPLLSLPEDSVPQTPLVSCTRIFLKLWCPKTLAWISALQRLHNPQWTMVLAVQHCIKDIFPGM